jgi:hypothetical protein
MTVSPGTSLDSAIAGISRGVENARKVATEINKDDSASAALSSKTSAASSTANTGGSRVGGSIDVRV